jgi:hypothetical protein
MPKTLKIYAFTTDEGALATEAFAASSGAAVSGSTPAKLAFKSEYGVYPDFRESEYEESVYSVREVRDPNGNRYRVELVPIEAAPESN